MRARELASRRPGVNVHGHELSAAELRSLVGDTRQVLGLRQLVLDDDVERGVRAIELRTAGGIDVTCLLERALDLGDASFDGVPLAWRAATGFAAPWFYDPRPMGFQRTMAGGLLVTAGLDHALFPAREEEPAYAYPLIGEREYPMHGRIAHTPARLVELAEDLDGTPPVLRVRAVARQASLFGEYLELDRSIEARIGEPRLTITDRITNRGGTAAPHMLLYHVNLGFPLLDPEAAPFSSPPLETTAAPANDGGEQPFSPLGEPVRGRVEQVYCHRLEADEGGYAYAGVVNPRLGIAFGLCYDTRALPFLFEWRVRRAGVYALGLEPSTADLGGRPGARAAGTLRMLEPGETLSYRLEFLALRAGDVASARAAFAAASAARSADD